MNASKSLQEKYAPKNVCFGCGAANPDGLHIRSCVKNDEVVAEWKPEKKYEAFKGVLNGGIIGTLLDCHCNWTAAYHLMKRARDDRPPCTVTAEYAIKLLRPTPSNCCGRHRRTTPCFSLPRSLRSLMTVRPSREH